MTILFYIFKGMGTQMAGVGAGPGGLGPQAVQQQGLFSCNYNLIVSDT